MIVTKSTVPVGTGREVARIIRETQPAAEFDVASNPEFLREGAAIEDFMKPDRVVIGVESQRARDIMSAVYRPLNLIQTPMVFTNIETAEVTIRRQCVPRDKDHFHQRDRRSVRESRCRRA